MDGSWLTALLGATKDGVLDALGEPSLWDRQEHHLKPDDRSLGFPKQGLGAVSVHLSDDEVVEIYVVFVEGPRSWQAALAAVGLAPEGVKAKKHDFMDEDRPSDKLKGVAHMPDGWKVVYCRGEYDDEGDLEEEPTLHFISPRLPY
ncbi:MAG: hypothetical protein ACK4XJ_08080 [Fimbriimonadaceae bacterium]